jgi:hypothetical protein
MLTPPLLLIVALASGGGKEADSPPLVEVQAGSAVLWRSYEFCPGAVDCGRKVFIGPEALKFETEQPYLAASARLVAFPLAGLDSDLRWLGLDGRYARGFLQVGVTDPTTQEVLWLDAADEVWSAELLYRRPFALGPVQGWHGVRAGAGSRRFLAPGGVEGTASRRRLGPLVGVEGAVPVLGPLLRVEVTARYALGLTPGSAEQDAFGDSVVASDGLLATVSLGGAVGSTGFGWTLSADYALFLDRFTGSGARSAGGSVREEYVAVVGAASYRFQ